MMPEDVPALIEVQEEASVVALGAIFPQDTHPFPREEIANRWRDEIADRAIAAFVSTDDAGRITGFAATRAHELLHFGVALHLWGTGLAQELYGATLTELRRTAGDAADARLRVFEENHRARRFYERLGWSRTGATSRTAFAPHPILLEYALPLR